MSGIFSMSPISALYSIDPTTSNSGLKASPIARKGGLRTMPFIMANETFEKVATYGLLANMILYLTSGYHMDAATGANVLFIWSAVSNFTPIFGAFLSDSYLGRFRVIALGSVASFLGGLLLWLTTLLPNAKPVNRGEQASPAQLCLLFSAFGLMSIGAGGIRPCSLAFGADQLDKGDTADNARTLQTFFNWYYASVGVSIMISVTAFVYIQDKFGYKVGFGIPALLMLLAAIFFLIGSSLYVKAKPNKSLFTGLFQTAVAAFKNKHLAFPPNNGEGWYHHRKGSTLVAPTQKLRFLNKACIVRSPDKYLNPEGVTSEPWNLCTVEQVEELKALIKVLPLWSTGIIIAVTISQHSFPVLQAKTMDRNLSSNFQIPPASYSAFGILTLTVWVVIYDRLLVPFLSKLTGNPRGIGLRQRMGIGLFISCITMSVAAMVENKRRNTATAQGLLNKGNAIVDMSAMWLVPQYCLAGLSEAFNAIGQIDFYYSQFPKSMSSIGVALFALGMGVGNLLGSLIVEIVDHVTSRGGRDSWVSNNLNRGRYDYYYWLLAILSLANFFYFLICSYLYGSCEDTKHRVWDEGEGTIYEVDSGESRELPMIVSV
ncbi:hypothetical protein ACHQM5_029511 [Ranunculus cassubicifolius]